MTAGTDDLRQRRHILFTMLSACAWRDSPAGAPPVVAGLRTFLGGWLDIWRPPRTTPATTGGPARAGWVGQ